MSKIIPCLWFNNNGEEAMNFYVSIFKNSKIENLIKPAPDAPTLGGSFVLEGQHFKFLNGGPQYQFNPAISLFVTCENQTEVDDLWKKLTADGGNERECGWLQDKFGVSWQIIPSILGKCLNDSDPEKAQRCFVAMMKMKKIDVEAIQKAYEGNQ